MLLRGAGRCPAGIVAGIVATVGRDDANAEEEIRVLPGGDHGEDVVRDADAGRPAGIVATVGDDANAEEKIRGLPGGGHGEDVVRGAGTGRPAGIVAGTVATLGDDANAEEEIRGLPGGDHGEDVELGEVLVSGSALFSAQASRIWGNELSVNLRLVPRKALMEKSSSTGSENPGIARLASG